LNDLERVSQQTTSTVGTWRTELKRMLSSCSKSSGVALVGMGHPFCSDDFAGSYLVKKLAVQRGRKLPEGIYLFDGEDNVEALITKIAQLEPENVVFVDSCEMKAEPGETRLISVTETSYPFFTTHGVPLKLLAEQVLTDSQVWILAIQPKKTDFGEHLSPEIQAAVDSASDFITSILKEKNQEFDN
jgi:hydrogenase maturation protease